MFRLCEVQGQSGNIVYLYAHDTGVTRDRNYPCVTHVTLPSHIV